MSEAIPKGNTDPRKTTDARRNSEIIPTELLRGPSQAAGTRFESATLSSIALSIEDQKKVVDWFRKGGNFLVYQGAPGCGKTHFCYAIYNEARKAGNFQSVRLWKESEFFQRVRSSMDKGGDYHAEVEHLMDYNLVIYDDMGSVGINDWRNEILLSFIDLRYEKKRPTIITSNLTESDIKEKIGYRLHSRLFAKENTILNFGEVDLRMSPQETGGNG